MVYVLHQTIIQSIMLIVLAVLVDGAKWKTVSDDSIWGWMQRKEFVYVSTVYGLVCGVYGTHGAIFAVKHFPLIPLMNSYLLRPIIAQLLGYLLGIDNIPGSMTFIGVTGLIFSIMFQKQGEVIRQKKEKEDNLEKVNRELAEKNLQEMTAKIDRACAMRKESSDDEIRFGNNIN